MKSAVNFFAMVLILLLTGECFLVFEITHFSNEVIFRTDYPLKLYLIPLVAVDRELTVKHHN